MVDAQKPVVGDDHDSCVWIDGKSRLLDLSYLAIENLQRSVCLGTERTMFVLLVIQIGQVHQQKARMELLQNGNSLSGLRHILIDRCRGVNPNLLEYVGRMVGRTGRLIRMLGLSAL